MFMHGRSVSLKQVSALTNHLLAVAYFQILIFYIYVEIYTFNYDLLNSFPQDVLLWF